MYKKEKLSPTLEILVNENHTFGTDAILLEQFSEPKFKDTICDLGTGCGIIPMLMVRDFLKISAENNDFSSKPLPEIYAVDIQKEAIDLLNATIAQTFPEKSENPAPQKNLKITNIFPINSDLKTLTTDFKHLKDKFSLVTCNPPYKAVGAGILNPNEPQKIARHEILCNIDDICKTSSELLKFGGRFCVCNRPERLADVISAMKAYKIEPKRLQFVSKDENSAPWLFLIEGKKGAKSFLKVLQPLYVRNSVGFSL
jgi:tRNA1(Val) A37 N6-methylase TrmN6